MRSPKPNESRNAVVGRSSLGHGASRSLTNTDGPAQTGSPSSYPSPFDKQIDEALERAMQVQRASAGGAGAGLDGATSPVRKSKLAGGIAYRLGQFRMSAPAIVPTATPGRHVAAQAELYLDNSRASGGLQVTQSQDKQASMLPNVDAKRNKDVQDVLDFKIAKRGSQDLPGERFLDAAMTAKNGFGSRRRDPKGKAPASRRSKACAYPTSKINIGSEDGRGLLPNEYITNRYPNSQLRFQRRSGTFAAHDKGVFLEQAWRRLAEKERTPDYDGVVAVLAGSKDTRVRHNPSKTRRAGSVQREVDCQLRDFVGGPSNAGKKRKELDEYPRRRKMIDEDARIEDGLGRWDRSRNTSGSVRLDRNAKEATPERLIAHKKVMAVANEIVVGGLGRKASSKDCVTALEHELQLQQSDDHIVQMEGKYNDQHNNKDSDLAADVHADGDRDYVSRYQKLRVFGDLVEPNDAPRPSNMTSMNRKSKKNQHNWVRKNKVQAKEFMQGTEGPRLLASLTEYQDAPSAKTSSEWDATAAQTSGHGSNERTRTAALHPTQPTPDAQTYHAMRLTKREGRQQASMNRTGQRFLNKREFEDSASYRGRNDVGIAKFSVPPSRDMQNSTTTNYSMLHKGKLKDLGRNSATPFQGIDSYGYDLDLFKTKAVVDTSESQTDDLMNQINELRALKQMKKYKQTENHTQKSTKNNLELLDNANVALDSTADEPQITQPEKQVKDIFGESFANVEAIQNGDCPQPTKKLQLQKNLQAIVKHLGAKGPVLQRSNETTKREKDLITRRLRSHLQQQEYLLDSEREYQHSSAVMSGRTTGSKTSPRPTVKSTLKSPRSPKTTNEIKQEDVLQIEGDSQSGDQRDFSFFVQKQSLFLSSLHMLNNSLIKQLDASVHGFLEGLFEKMNQNTKELDQFLQSVSRQKELLKKGLDNLTAEHLNLKYECNQLRSQQAAFTNIITQSKKNEEDFEKMFAAAHDFLKSQSLAGFIEQLEELESQTMPEQQQKLQNQIKKLLTIARADQEGEAELSSAPDHKINRLEADFLAFSGVTDKLDEVISQLSLNQAGNPNASQQIELEESAFKTFVHHLESRMSFAQIQTAYKLWARIRKIQTFAEAGVQVGAADLDQNVQRQLNNYQMETDAQRQELLALTDQLARKDAELEAHAKKVAHEMSNSRALRQEIDRLEQSEEDHKAEIEKLIAEREQHEKRVTRLQDEIRITRMTMDKYRSENLAMTPSPGPPPWKAEATAPDQDEPKRDEAADKELVVEGSPRGKAERSKSESSSTQDKHGREEDDSERKNRAALGQRQAPGTEDVPEQVQNEDLPFVLQSPAQALNLRAGDGAVSPSRKPRRESPKKQSPPKRAPKKEAFAAQTTEMVRERKAQPETPSLPLFDEAPVMEAKLQGTSASKQKSKNAETGKRNYSLESHDRSFDRNDTEVLPAAAGNGMDLQKDDSDACFKVARGSDYMNPKFVYPKHSKPPTRTVSVGVQTDQQVLFEYILAFLKVVEERIKEGAIAPDIIKDPSTSEIENLQEQQRLMEKSRARLKELQQILGRIGSLRNGRGGDIFFKSLAKTFQVNPIVPAVLQRPSEPLDRWQSDTIPNSDIFGSPTSQTATPTQPPTPQRYIVKTKLASSAGGGYLRAISKRTEGAHYQAK